MAEIIPSTFTFDISNPAAMDSPTNQAMTDRFNGVFSPLEISAEAFKTAYDTPDIGPHIEKDYKGLSYLSWPFAYRYLKEHFPSLYVAFEEKTVGEVVFGGPGYYYLRPYLTDGMRRTVALIFPVMDRKHNAIKELDGRAVSDNCQRAAVKAIATFTGLGLRLYAGEDIPKEEAAKPALQQGTPKPARTAKAKAAPKEEPVAEAAPAFDGKTVLTDLCKANPFGYEGNQNLTAGKEALAAVGMARATEMKNWQDFGRVVRAMTVNWTKEQQLAYSKDQMRAELDLIGSALDLDQMVAAIKVFIAKKP